MTILWTFWISSSSVTISLEKEPKLKNAVLELAFVAMLVVDFPFSVHNFKGNVFVWWACTESENGKVRVIASDKGEVRSLSRIKQIRIENLQNYSFYKLFYKVCAYIESVSLHNFRRRIIDIVVSLIVFIPIKACMNLKMPKNNICSY